MLCIVIFQLLDVNLTKHVTGVACSLCCLLSVIAVGYTVYTSYAVGKSFIELLRRQRKLIIFRRKRIFLFFLLIEM